MSQLSLDMSYQPLWSPLVLAALLLGTAWLLLSRRRKSLDAPQVPGLPVLGNAIGLGRHGVAYIRKCREKFGDTFSLSLAGPRMTFFFEPSHIDYFFSAPDDMITFRPAVEQFTQRVFGLTSRLFFPLHFKMLTELRHLLVPATLNEHMRVLGTRALELLPCYVHHMQVDLYSLCRGLVFHCVVETLFGRAFVEALPDIAAAIGEADQAGQEGGQQADQEEQGAAGGGGKEGQENGGAAEEVEVMAETANGPMVSEEEEEDDAAAAPWAALASWGGGAPLPRPPVALGWLSRTFFTFEDGFELAASPVPHLFQSGFVRSRAALLRVLTEADRRGLFAGTPAGQLLDRTTGLPPHLRPNLLLALLWASQANSVPGTFWSVAFLLLPENQHHMEAVRAELQAELQSTASSVPAAASPGDASTPTSMNSNTGSNGRSSTASEVVAAATRLAASRRSAVSRCVAEALRLRVQSIDVRQAAATLDLPTLSAPGGQLRIPRGRMLAVCPFESHHDTKLCPAGPDGGSDPWVFDPNRPELRLGDGSAVVPSVAGLAFGGGPYRCPGRFFAEQELGLLVQVLLWSYDMQLSYGDPSIRLAAGVQAAGGPATPSKRTAAAQNPLDVAPQPQLQAVQGGSLLYGTLAVLVGPSALAWGCGWFDGLDGPIQDWRRSGDPAALLPPCDLRRLVGVKVPRKPCWVQLGRPVSSSAAAGN